jgi:hypothetical protein
MPVESRTFRLFVSSTFDDLEHERNGSLPQPLQMFTCFDIGIPFNLP